MSVFSYLRGKLQKTIEKGVEPSEAKETYEEERARQKKEMLEEARRKRRAKVRYSGRRVFERKGRKESEKRKEEIHYKLNKRISNITLKLAQYIAKTKANAIRVEEEYIKYEDEPEPEPEHVYYFYDKDDKFVAQYNLEDKELAKGSH